MLVATEALGTLAGILAADVSSGAVAAGNSDVTVIPDVNRPVVSTWTSADV
jgi:hypothetical protein